ncbi:MAG: metal ABC transporter ATP-binding protein [Acidimicrobiales bacterium]
MSPDAPLSKPTVHAEELTVTFDGSHALDRVSFSAWEGTSTALVGANGSGKSTLLNTIAGIQRPSAGAIEVGPTTIAYVLQFRGRGAWLPLLVDEVLAMGRYRQLGSWKRMRRADRLAMSEAAARVGVENLRGKQFGELSGGQRQRVLVAQALVQQAPLLLMDEPITGLDMPSQDRILEVIEQETDSGRTVMISTHHLDEAHHCDQVLLLDKQLIASGPPGEVLTPETLRRAYESHLFGAHAGHDHPQGLLLLDEHGHDHDHGAEQH